MAKIIKKIKMKKSDGTMSDYIPIGTEAENVNVDGESVEIKLNKIPYYYNSVADMKADTKLKVGDMAITLGYNNANDRRGSIFSILDQSSGYYTVNLNNGLYANLSNNQPRNILNENGNNQFEIVKSSLYGDSPTTFPLEMQEGNNYIIKLENWHNKLESLYLKNSNFISNATAITCESTSANVIRDISIDGRFKTGINLLRSSYSKLDNVSIVQQSPNITHSTIALSMGNPENREQWLGVISIIDSHFDRYGIGIQQNSNNTNTLSIDRCSFEVDDIGIENYGKLYINNTYFGDNVRPNNVIQNVLIAYGGSQTYVRNSTIGLSAYDTTSNEVNSTIALKDGALVEINGGIISVGSQSNQNKPSGIYTSTSAEDRIFLDNVLFVPSTANKFHSCYPYYLYSYSPLRSYNPIKNYIINGTFTNPIITTENISTAQFINIETDLVNPFGGAYLTSIKQESLTDEGVVTCYYKIPKEKVGTPMILEGYAYSDEGYLTLKSDGLFTDEKWASISGYTYKWKRCPAIFRFEVIPTKTTGWVTFGFRFNALQGNTFSLASLILKDKEYKNYLSCYKDANPAICAHIPTNTVDAVKGDIVYALDPLTAGAMGWIFNGTTWQPYQQLESQSI